MDIDQDGTLQACFYNFGFPLAPDGWNASDGAVGSLQTGYSGISSLNANGNVGIPNAYVGAILAGYPDDGTSLLRAVLNEVASATIGGAEDSLRQIVQGQENSLNDQPGYPPGAWPTMF